MATYEFDISPKMLRELLCSSQSALIHSKKDVRRNSWGVDEITKMISVIDEMRPLGVDGKHGNRHTDNCGCNV